MLHNATLFRNVPTVKHVSFATTNCSLAQSIEMVGEWWSLLILREAFFGVRRFSDFERYLGISRNILTARLSKLVAAEILQRAPARDLRLVRLACACQCSTSTLRDRSLVAGRASHVA